MSALEGRRSLRRVAHNGAEIVAPANTFASFDAALAAGVDMIEFDVLPERGTRRLILAHDRAAADRGTAPSLEDGLAHFASDAYADIELNVDLKLAGYEALVVRALHEHGLAGRALVSSQHTESLALIRSLEPRVRLGWSLPRVRRDYTSSRVTVLPALGALVAYRRALPRRADRAIRAGRCDAIMAHWRLVTPRLVSTVRAAGGDLFVWTVDDPARIRALELLGVTGVITNDPALFGALG
jgi:glycerophosphoryl diester phosphodiesterase